MSETSLSKRIAFHDDLEVMEVDFSDMAFETSAMVNSFYDEVDRSLTGTGRKWYFLVNYKNCSIDPAAWVAFAHRGKRTNLAHSLGTVRFAAPDETERTIKEKSEKEQFEANLYTSRDAALARLAQMRADARR